MIRAIRCELVRLRNPYLYLGGIGLMVVLGLVATTVIFVTAKEGSAPAPPGVKFATVSALEAPDGMFVGLENAASMLGVVVLAIWALATTSDYTNGLIRLLVQAEPSRLRLLGGKIAALAVFTCLATLVTTMAVLVVSPGIAGVAGVSTDAWGTDMAPTAIEGYLHLTLAAVLWGVVGLCIGVITRSGGAAIALGIGYLLVFEGLMSLLLENASTWLPGSSIAAVASGGTADVGYGTALLVAVAYAVTAIGIAAAVFGRRDITA